MTDRERIEKTYEKIKKKYPDVVNKEEIDDLAIRHEKRFSLLCCLGLLAGAVLCFVLAFVIKSFSDTRYILFITGAFQLYEIVHILAKYSKIEKMYRPVETVTYQGLLTREQILKDGGKLLKKAEEKFTIERRPLFDKEDDTEVGFDNMTSHSYHLYFKVGEFDRIAPVKTKKSTYMEAAIGAMYYVVLTPQGEIAAVYQASNWNLSGDLYVCCKDIQQPVTEQPAYQPAPVVKTTEKEPTKKLLPILAMTLAAASYFTVILLGIPMAVAALVLSIVGLAKQRSKLSIAGVIVTVLLTGFLIVSVVVAFMTQFA